MINRGIAKRPLFERRSDMRFFLARLARQIRMGRIEVHAYCLMTTHFHLLVRSPAGDLSEAMRRVQNEYSKRFNREHRRDGALIRGRYFSRPVESVRYRRVLVSYIDANPVRAGIVLRAGDYEFSSARAYMHGKGSPWLSREWVEGIVAFETDRPLSAESYRATFGSGSARDSDALDALVEARLRAPVATDDLDDLIGSAPSQVRAWMADKCRLADGHEPGLPVVGHLVVCSVLQEHIAESGVWFVQDGRKDWRGEDLARVALMRQLCGMTWTSIAGFMGIPTSTVARMFQTHARLLEQDSSHADRVAEMACRAIARVFRC